MVTVTSGQHWSKDLRMENTKKVFSILLGMHQWGFCSNPTAQCAPNSQDAPWHMVGAEKKIWPAHSFCKSCTKQALNFPVSLSSSNSIGCMPPLFTITLSMPGVFLHTFRTPAIPYIIPNTLLPHICITGGISREPRTDTITNSLTSRRTPSRRITSAVMPMYFKI